MSAYNLYRIAKKCQTGSVVGLKSDAGTSEVELFEYSAIRETEESSSWLQLVYIPLKIICMGLSHPALPHNYVLWFSFNTLANN